MHMHMHVHTLQTQAHPHHAHVCSLAHMGMLSAHRCTPCLHSHALVHAHTLQPPLLHAHRCILHMHCRYPPSHVRLTAEHTCVYTRDVSAALWEHLRSALVHSEPVGQPHCSPRVGAAALSSLLDPALLLGMP